MRCALIDHTAPSWPAEVDRLYAGLAPAGAALLPTHFVKTTFVKMGGRLLTVGDGDMLLAAGLLFPRALEGGRPVYTLRLHELGPLPPDDELRAAVESLIAPGRALLYRPEEGRSFGPTHAPAAGFDLGAPAREELAAARRLHGAIWGVAEAESYPDDLYSAEFAPGTALVARRDGQVVGFLLGFRRFGLPALDALGLPFQLGLAMESQVMGVAPEQRRSGLAVALKREQARLALAAGVDLIHWTADPLQYPNAVLNFARLRAVAGEFTPAYYPFQNALNRVAASRLGISWLPRSARGRAGLADGPRAEDRSLRRFPGCVVLNEGPVALAGPVDAPHIAVEIPADWTALQRDEPELAAAWRQATDALFAACLGYAQGRYVVADAAAEGPRRYLVAHRFTPDLLSRF
jgi:predicted GNAT superfamily acetyltransferase